MRNPDAPRHATQFGVLGNTDSYGSVDGGDFHGITVRLFAGGSGVAHLVGRRTRSDAVDPVALDRRRTDLARDLSPQ